MKIIDLQTTNMVGLRLPEVLASSSAGRCCQRDFGTGELKPVTTNKSMSTTYQHRDCAKV